MRVLRREISGADVLQLQTDLRGLGHWPKGAGDEADFGELTEEATMKFQESRGIEPADGEAGPVVLAALRGEIGELQSALARHSKKYFKAVPDGRFCEELKGALARFQSDNRLKDSGVLDDATRKALYNSADAKPASFKDQLHLERDAILFLRREFERDGANQRNAARDPLADRQILGLAFSGGGIRSATFNLGVIQTLAQLGLLKHVDYLSTVSGGGYIGGWLSAWNSRLGGDSRKLEQEIVNASEGTDGLDKATQCEPLEIDWLRRYSNYLTPRTGVLGVDFLQGAVTWARNVLLNQYILIAFLCVLLLLPWVLAAVLVAALSSEAGGDGCVALFIWALALVAGSLATFFLAFRSARLTFRRAHLVNNKCVGYVVAGLYIFAALFAGIGLIVPFPGQQSLTTIALWGCAAYFMSWIFGWSLSSGWSDEGSAWLERRQEHFASLRGGAAGAAVLALAFVAIGALFKGNSGAATILHAAVLGMPLASAAILLALTAQIGFAGRGLGESLREWWSRLGAVIVQWNILWLALACAALYSPFGVLWSWRTGVEWIAAAGGLAWAFTTIGGVLAGASVRTGDKGRGGWVDVLARFAPYAFCVGLMVTISFGLYESIDKLWPPASSSSKCLLDTAAPQQPAKPETSREAASANLAQQRPAAGAFSVHSNGVASTLSRVNESFVRGFKQLRTVVKQLFENPREEIRAWKKCGMPGASWIVALSFFGAATVLAFYLDVNIFSLHMFYRSRLERCFLGASHKNRKQDDFTGLDAEDSPQLTALVQRPLPIINTALNVTQGGSLAWQERKGGSFTFTPFYCGFEFRNETGDEEPAYQPTTEYVGDEFFKAWISLKMPMTISGAAASPNWGYHTNPATSFLMTMFNVRLGWWIQNPRKNSAWRRAGPKWASRSLLKELTGSTTAEKDFVYVSDGGHFENLGLYELVRRRCRYVIVCDVGCDPHYQFEDLGNAIRKIRIDMGIPIDIDVRMLAPDPKTGNSEFHCAMGRINYQCADSSEQQGYLLYIKPTLCGHEPADVRQYRDLHPTFPHETTADQWFGESQFESYRQLGKHVAQRVLEDSASSVRDGKPITVDYAYNLETLFRSLSERWFSPSAMRGSFSKHGDTVAQIFERLRMDPRLRFLDAQIYPEWPHLTKGANEAPRPEMMLPDSYPEVRAGFYFCNQLFQLMENVYHDLNLESDRDHPDNRGWMNLFRHWSWSGMFRVAWAVSASTYGARFQTFCRERLDLKDLYSLNCKQAYNLYDLSLAPEEDESLASGVMLNFLEKSKLRELRKHYHESGRVGQMKVIPLRLDVPDPMTTSGKKASDEDGPAPPFSFTFGVALVELAPGSAVLRYFRVQDHLRGTGLGTKALQELKEQYHGIVLGELDETLEAAPSKEERIQLRRLAGSVGIELEKRI